MNHFCEDITACKTAALLKINRNTINRYFNLFRRKIAASTFDGGVLFSDEIECDESYFGAKRVRGKRGHGAAVKTHVFGLLKRGGYVHVEIVQNCSKEQLMPII